MKPVAAELQGNVRATSPFNSGSFEISGVEAHFPDMRTLPIGDGRFFTDKEEKAGERVCIIGVDVNKQLFADRPDIIGTSVAINGIPFRIIGVMADKNQNSSYSGLDEKKIWLPYTSMTRDVPPAKNYSPATWTKSFTSPSRSIEFDDAQRQVRRILGRDHGFDPLDKSALGIWDTVKTRNRWTESSIP